MIVIEEGTETSITSWTKQQESNLISMLQNYAKQRYFKDDHLHANNNTAYSYLS